MASLVTQSKAAEMAGTSRAAVSQASRNMGALSECRHGTKIDIDSERWKAWASRFSPTETRGRGRPKVVNAPTVSDGDTIDASDDMEELKRLKLCEEIREKQLKNAALEHSVISREFVTTHLFGILEELSRRLLADASRTIVSDCYVAAQSGVSVEDSEVKVREILSKNIRKARDGARRKIRGVDND